MHPIPCIIFGAGRIHIPIVFFTGVF
ncbi:uncharacterized protein METZ01_LOCUS143872, partial [marine metagenome]